LKDKVALLYYSNLANKTVAAVVASTVYCYADLATTTMEFLPMTFTQAMQHPTFDFATREQVMLQLVMTIAWLHSRSQMVLHCDLKPQNILMTADFRPKVSDCKVAQCIFIDMQQCWSFITHCSSRHAVVHSLFDIVGFDHVVLGEI